jgi:ClpP class serine protease
MEWLKQNIKIVLGTMALVLGLVSAILAFDDRYATSKELAKMEQQTVQTLQQFKNNMEQDHLQRRYMTLTDQEMQLKILIQKYPSDAGLKEDYNNVREEKRKVQEKLDKMRDK